MLPALAQNLGEEVGGAIGHDVLFAEILRGGDKDGDLHQLRDVLQISDCGLDLCQYVDRTSPRSFLAGSCIEISSQQTGGNQFAVNQRQLACCQEQLSTLGKW